LGLRGPDNWGVEKTRIQELYDLYCLLNTSDQIEKNEMGVACSTYGGQESSIHVLVGEPRERGD